MPRFALLLPRPGSRGSLGEAALPDGVLLAEGMSPFMVADARLDGAADLRNRLGLGPGDTDERILDAAWKRWGPRLTDEISGDFALARWDPMGREVFVARDHMGVRPLYVARAAAGTVVASDLGSILRFPGVDRSVDDAHVAEMLTDWWFDHEATFYEGVRRIPDGHRAWISEDGRIRQERYWHLSGEELRLGSDREYEDRFRTLFQQAVLDRVSGQTAIGTEFSGGLDSATVAGALQKRTGEHGGLLALSCSFDAPRYDGGKWDEHEFREWLRPLPGVRLVEFPAAEAISSEALDWSIAANHAPIGGAMYLVRQHMYRQAVALGATVIFDGQDGDSTVGYGHARLTRLFLHGQWFAFLSEVMMIRRRLGWKRAARAAGSYGLIAPTSWATWYLGRQSRALNRTLVSPELLQRTDLWRRARRAAFARPDHVRQSHIVDVHSAVHQLALEACAAYGDTNGIGPRHPYYDRRLIEFAVSLPDDQLMRGGVTRSIQRRSLRGYAPDDILGRTDKGALPKRFISDVLRSADAEDVLANGGGLAAPFIDQQRLPAVWQRWQRDASVDDSYALHPVVILHRWLATGEVSL